MKYAVINNSGAVTNVIEVNPLKAHHFMSIVPCEDFAVTKGDYYAEGSFFRDGERIESYREILEKAIEIYESGEVK